jgi:predicted ATPase
MAYPDAVILELTNEGMKQTKYIDTENYKVSHSFLNNYEGMIDILLNGE